MVNFLFDGWAIAEACLCQRQTAQVKPGGSGSALSELLAGIPNLISRCDELRGFRAHSLKNFRHVEDCLIQSNLFNLPKDLPEGEGIDWNVVIVDATEIPIQRPKKTEEKL